jgi:hypothetical protein
MFHFCLHFRDVFTVINFLIFPSGVNFVSDAPKIVGSILSRPTNAQHICINNVLCIVSTHVLQFICIIFRESYPAALTKLQKSSGLQTEENNQIKMYT